MLQPFLRALALSSALVLAPASAAVLTDLYEATVAGEAGDPQHAAEDALREVVTRVTGRRAAAGDPALAALIAGARDYVQTLRSAGPGQVAVAFDAQAVDEALMKAGQPLWSRERPTTLVVLVLERPGAARSILTAQGEAEERRQMERAALARGLPLLWPAFADPVETAKHTGEAQDGRSAALLELARRMDAEAVLVGRQVGAQYQWSAAGSAAAGPLAGSPAEVVQLLADRYAANFATAAGAAFAATELVVSGIADYKAYGATLAYLSGLTNVKSVGVLEVSGDTVRFLVSYRGDPAALYRSVTLGGKLLPDANETEAALRFHRLP
jgi:uncharacterized protein